jgi:hypothetical protein
MVRAPRKERKQRETGSSIRIGNLAFRHEAWYKADDAASGGLIEYARGLMIRIAEDTDHQAAEWLIRR